MESHERELGLRWSARRQSPNQQKEYEKDKAQRSTTRNFASCFYLLLHTYASWFHVFSCSLPARLADRLDADQVLRRGGRRRRRRRCRRRRQRRVQQARAAQRRRQEGHRIVIVSPRPWGLQPQRGAAAAAGGGVCLRLCWCWCVCVCRGRSSGRHGDGDGEAAGGEGPLQVIGRHVELRGVRLCCII